MEECDHLVISSAVALEEYVIALCGLIGMKRFGPFEAVHFGEDEKIAGFTVVQKIETSLISGHFVDSTGDAYIDVFSCKEFDWNEATEFTRGVFRPKWTNIDFAQRGRR